MGSTRFQRVFFGILAEKIDFSRVERASSPFKNITHHFVLNSRTSSKMLNVCTQDGRATRPPDKIPPFFLLMSLSLSITDTVHGST